MNNHNRTIAIIFIVTALLGVVLLMIGCSPVKRVVNNQKYYGAVRDIVISNGECVNDTTYVSDTTILLDTLYNIEYKSDTVTIGDSVWIDRVEYREKVINKTVTVRDTAIVADNSRIELLQKQLFGKTEQLNKANNDLKDLKTDFKGMKQERNKWRLYFFLLLFGIGLWFARKPILKLISPIKL